MTDLGKLQVTLERTQRMLKSALTKESRARIARVNAEKEYIKAQTDLENAYNSVVDSTRVSK